MPPALQLARRTVQRVVGSEVREGEWRLVLLFFANLFLLLGAYYILKVIREPLILLEGGAVERSEARALQAVLLLFFVPAYGLLSDRFEPAKLVKWVMGACVACVAVFVALAQAGVKVGFAFFVWLGIFSTVAIAQFWSLASDVLTEREGRRLFPLVAVGGTLGGIGGAQLAARMMDGRPQQLMLVAAALLVSCALLTHITYEAAMAHRARIPHDASQHRDGRGGLTLVVHDRYLLLIALSVLVLNFINTTGDFMVAGAIGDAARQLATRSEQQRFIAGYYADLQTYVSVLTSLAQVLLVARFFKKLGPGNGFLCLPLLALMGYAAAALAPRLGLLTVVKVAQDSSEYSLHNTSEQALFLRTSRDAKYKAKAAVDTLFVRLGDLLAAAAVYAGSRLGFGIAGYGVLNLIFSAVWVAIAWRLRSLAQAPGSPIFRAP